ncbi:trans-sialidase, putative [Trypanosoma cruzi marinkellei]|uniref:Trans-sialidase, putative n=1 Tax=Trypanosoma cruzi marinkellei TaxID=85056 RepID=K2NKB6_TRYCR|nr:trans-sialidase, putative [Trypanosoma cruzi marinkellei]
MLVTLPVYTEEVEEDKEKGVLHLWLTDNTHIVDIGPVSGDDDVAASSLLYNSETKELIALYEKKGNVGTSHSIWSVRLTDELQRVKDVLATWKKVDDIVSQLCPSNAEKGAPTTSVCSAVKITAGLVGFLSGNFSDNTWRDEYLGVNATVHNVGAEKATRTSDGVKFRGAWAEWPVGQQGENQLYHFANYNFTLVATVSIHKVPEGDTPIPLIGVKMNDTENTVLLGLSYNSEKKWILLCNGTKVNGEHSSTLHSETDATQYHVAIVLQNRTQGTAYVDGKRVEDAQCEWENKEDKNVSHFYIGGDERSAGNSGSHEDVSVTVKNVLLYNRLLDENDINALKPTKGPNMTPKVEKAQETVLPPPVKPQPAGQKLSSGNNGGNGGIASTSAGSASTTTSGRVQPVNQFASGAASGGNANVDGAPSSNGAPTVAEGSEDTLQGDGPHTPSVGDTPATADANVGSNANGETVGRTVGQGEEDAHPQDGEVNATAVNSSFGNLLHGKNSDAGTVRESGILPSLLLLLLGLWGFAAL